MSDVNIHHGSAGVYSISTTFLVNIAPTGQWCKVTKYMYLSTVLKYTFELSVLYLSNYHFRYFHFYLHYITDPNIVLLVHYVDLKTLVISYFSDIDYDIVKHARTTSAIFYTYI